MRSNTARNLLRLSAFDIVCACVECKVGDKIRLGIDELLEARETASRVWYLCLTMKARSKKSNGTR